MNNLLSSLQQGLQQNTQQANQSNILQQQQIIAYYRQATAQK